MKRLLCLGILCATALILGQSDSASVDAQVPTESAPAQRLPLQPRQPGGFLKNGLGVYVTIEGVLYSGEGKVESNSLVVDTVDGNKLEEPILILIKHVRIPENVRCVLKGYELGAMIGNLPAFRQAAEEGGKRYVESSASPWGWRPYFIPLIAVKPKGLTIQEVGGITKQH